jgi:hypothetical protein
MLAATKRIRVCGQLAPGSRPRLTGVVMPKIEVLAGPSKGKIRADVAYRKITAMGYRGSERPARRASQR